MILRFNFEELRALASAGESLVATGPREAAGRIEKLLPRLTGDVSIETLDDQRAVRRSVAAIVDDLKVRMDRTVLENGPANEEAVNLYFDYGHSRTVLHRLDVMGGEMEALADLMTGGHPEVAGAIHFPD
jgi:hypothetical protein